MSARIIEYLETGKGCPILFVPGSFSRSAAWRPLQKGLPETYRMASTSLCGYGATHDPRSLKDISILHEVGVIEAAAAKLGEAFHLVGHSFGATVSLAAALKGRLPIKSLSLFEANPLWLLKEASGEDLFSSTEEMARDFETALKRGEEEAAARIIDFWGGLGAFEALPEAVRAYCREKARTNLLDWKTDFAFEVTGQDCSRLEIPTLLVRGELANPAMLHMTEVLAEALPNRQCEVVPGASHFLISSHPEPCAMLIDGFISQQENNAT